MSGDGHADNPHSTTGRPPSQASSSRRRLVVHPPKFVSMSAQDQRRAQQAFKALLIPYLRTRRVSQRDQQRP